MTPPEPSSHVVRLQRLAAAMRQRIEFVERSRFWQLRERWFALKRRFFFGRDIAPPAIPELDYAEAMETSDPYAWWLLENEARTSDLHRLRDLLELLPERPSIAIVVDDVVVDDDRDAASVAIAAASAQVYPCTVVRTSTYAAGAADPMDQARRWQLAFEAVETDVVVFCTATELLAPDAAAEVALAFLRDPGTAFAYGDRDERTKAGVRKAPTFAPGWSPETFLGYAYTGSVLWFRCEAIRRAGPFRVGFGAASRYELALRATDAAPAVHRARILHHDLVPVGTSVGSELAPWHAARADALERRGARARFAPVPTVPTAEIIDYELAAPLEIDIVIPTRDHAEDLERCLTSLYAISTYEHVTVTVVDNGSVEPATAALLERMRVARPDRFRTVRVDEPFNFSRLVNIGVGAGTAPIVVLLNNDTEVLDPTWLESLAGYCSSPAVGAVGTTLLYPDGTLQHAGVVVGIGELAGHVYRFGRPDDVVDPLICVPRNVAAVTAAVVAIRRETFLAVGGFDEALAVEYNDIDFCLRVARTGLRNVCLPHARLVHFESKTRGTDDTPTKRARSDAERAIFRARYTETGYRDIFYNPHLTTVDESGSFDVPVRLRAARHHDTMRPLA